MEAVQEAKEQQPDLIVLDIGLPALDGVEAAKRILHVAPGAIIFFTSINDRDVVRAVRSDGAQGFVLKTDGHELLTALEAVLGGDDFVSSGIEAADSAETGDAYLSL